MHLFTRRSAIASFRPPALPRQLSGGGRPRLEGSIKGDPQPEIKPFTIGKAAGGGTVAIGPSGTLITAYTVSTSNTDGAAEVCVLARGGHKCTHKVTLNTLSNDDVFGVPQVFALPDKHVAVLQNTCCDASPDGSNLLWTSTDGGATFGPPVRVGNVGVAGAALIGSQIVFGAGDPHSGTQVAAIPENASAPQLNFAQVTNTPPSDVSITDYKGGALVANDVLGADYTTSVEFAKSGSDFNSGSAYKKVVSFPHEHLLAVSGSALLTSQTKGKQDFLLRFFNGTKFGAAHAVPGYKGQLGYWTTLDQDSSGVTHVFVESSFVAPIYDLLETSTANGTHWSGRTDLGNAIDSNVFNVALDSSGSGLVIGNGNSRSIGYPVLAHQTVTFSLSHSSIKKGKSVIGKGKGSKAAKGRVVELQVEKAGKWYDVKSTHEKANGSFTFTIKDTAIGTRKYRAVAADHAGYVQFGYSSARSLTVKK